jgi:pectin methylesterase-like acyl-CoA thioesterase
MKTIKKVAVQCALSGLVLTWASFQASAAALRVPARYPTIQAAVDAAVSGDEIRIAAGTYSEQVMITSKNLRLVGEPGAVLKAFPGMTGIT